jgi:hypothetical protein
LRAVRRTSAADVRVNDAATVKAIFAALPRTRDWRRAGPADNLKIYMRFVADYRRNWMRFGIALSSRIGKLIDGRNAAAARAQQ